jgi:hypothetical protein
MVVSLYNFNQGVYMKTILILSLLSIIACGTYENGQTGAPGKSLPCTVTSVNSPMAGSLIQCPDGTSSFVASGTVISPVQFCPGTTKYPTEFNEIGFLINGNIYAVYSINNGFMSLIPPGYYTSNAINSTCNFTVNADGTITN